MKKRAKATPHIEYDSKGAFVRETVFIGGKQKRVRRRVDVVDGEIIEDFDAWLLANADDIYLHQEGRWDLIEQRRLDEET